MRPIIPRVLCAPLLLLLALAGPRTASAELEVSDEFIRVSKVVARTYVAESFKEVCRAARKKGGPTAITADAVTEQLCLEFATTLVDFALTAAEGDLTGDAAVAKFREFTRRAAVGSALTAGSGWMEQELLKTLRLEAVLTELGVTTASTLQAALHQDLTCVTGLMLSQGEQLLECAGHLGLKPAQWQKLSAPERLRKVLQRTQKDALAELAAVSRTLLEQTQARETSLRPLTQALLPLRQEAQRLSRELAGLEGQVTELTRGLQADPSRAASLQSQLAALEGKRQAASSQLQVVQARIEPMVRQQAPLHDDLALLGARRRALERVKGDLTFLLNLVTRVASSVQQERRLFPVVAETLEAFNRQEDRLLDSISGSIIFGHEELAFGVLDRRLEAASQACFTPLKTAIADFRRERQARYHTVAGAVYRGDVATLVERHPLAPIAAARGPLEACAADPAAREAYVAAQEVLRWVDAYLLHSRLSASLHQWDLPALAIALLVDTARDTDQAELELDLKRFGLALLERSIGVLGMQSYECRNGNPVQCVPLGAAPGLDAAGEAAGAAGTTGTAGTPGTAGTTGTTGTAGTVGTTGAPAAPGDSRPVVTFQDDEAFVVGWVESAFSSRAARTSCLGQVLAALLQVPHPLTLLETSTGPAAICRAGLEERGFRRLGAADRTARRAMMPWTNELDEILSGLGLERTGIRPEVVTDAGTSPVQLVPGDGALEAPRFYRWTPASYEVEGGAARLKPRIDAESATARLAALLGSVGQGPTGATGKDGLIDPAELLPDRDALRGVAGQRALAVTALASLLEPRSDLGRTLLTQAGAAVLREQLLSFIDQMFRAEGCDTSPGSKACLLKALAGNAFEPLMGLTFGDLSGQEFARELGRQLSADDLLAWTPLMVEVGLGYTQIRSWSDSSDVSHSLTVVDQWGLAWKPKKAPHLYLGVFAGGFIDALVRTVGGDDADETRILLGITTGYRRFSPKLPLGISLYGAVAPPLEFYSADAEAWQYWAFGASLLVPYDALFQ